VPFPKTPRHLPDDGKTIPSCDLSFFKLREKQKMHKLGLINIVRRDKNLTSIRDLKDGKYGKISFIRGAKKCFSELLDMVLTPGTRIRL
jgi:hypothetical protein